MFNGATSAIERAAHADSAVRMAGNFALLAVGFVDHRLDFVQSQRRLRDQMALLVDPRTMRHVDLDPVSAVINLLARDLAQFDWTIAELRALGDDNVRIVAFQRISAGNRDRARHHEQARAGNVSGIDGLLDADVAVTTPFVLNLSQPAQPPLQCPPPTPRPT